MANHGLALRGTAACAADFCLVGESAFVSLFAGHSIAGSVERAHCLLLLIVWL